MNGLVKKQIKRKQIRRWVLFLCLFSAVSGRGLAADNITVGSEISNGSKVVVSEIQVVINGTPDQREPYSYMAKRLIRLHPGESLDKEAIEESIKALKLSNRFSAIHVDSISEPDGEKLIFTLTPSMIVSDIRIQGEYPLFERDILNRITLYPGDPLIQADLVNQSKAIIKLYKREGYVDPKVSIKTKPDSSGQQAVIFIDIDKGPHYVLGRLSFQGNHFASSDSLKWRMKVWLSDLLPIIGRFSENRLKKDMASLLAYYRGKGFADAELSYHIDYPADSHKANVTVHVQEGPRYEISFEGNQEFWDLTLNKDLVVFTEGNRHNSGVRKSIQNIKKRYHEEGFLEARIKVETTKVPGPSFETRRLRFVIQEGPQTLVDKVTIKGNQALSEKKIKEQILTRPPSLFHDGAFIPETLQMDTFAVTTLYMNHGFTDRTVDSDVTFKNDKTEANVLFNIQEGPKTIIRSIAINGLTGLLETEARKALAMEIGDPFRTPALDTEKEALSSLLSEKGFLYATVQSKVLFSGDRTEADIVYEIDQGQQVTLGDIFISGNLRTDEKIIRRELDVKPQSPLSLQALYDGQRRLRDMDIFHGVTYRTIGLKEKEKTVDLFVEVQENKPYYAEVSLGYESDTGVYGSTKVGDRNLFGLNKELWASGKISETGHRLETRLIEPRLLGTRISAGIGLYNEELTEFNQSFGTRTTGSSLTFGYDWGKYIITSLDLRLENREQFNVGDRSAEAVNEETRTILVATPNISYDSRDSFVRPTKGFLSSLNLEFSKGIQNQLDDFVRYQFDTRYYWTPFKRVTFAGLARIGQVIPYANSDLVPEDQLFYLGGIQSVRGFDENLLRADSEGKPVGGKTAILGSLEARIDLGMNLELATFFDVGSVQDTLVDGGSDRFRPTVGLGLRYITPIGPIGLLYGHKLDGEPGESSGRVYFSIGYSF